MRGEGERVGRRETGAGEGEGAVTSSLLALPEPEESLARRIRRFNEERGREMEG